MSNSYFQFKQFKIYQDHCAMKVTTDSCLFGAWVAGKAKSGKSATCSVLDIGTGTGLLSLMLAQKINTFIDAIEIDKDSFEQAIENVKGSEWNEKITVHHIDAKEFAGDILYDLIICNPPFYENELKSGNNQKNIAHHSDKLELSELLDIIKNNLATDGIFCLLLPFKRNNEIKILLSENRLSITRITYVRQSKSHDYFRIMLIGKFTTDEITDPVIDEISIKDNTPEQSYTPAFTDLLKDYYLHL
ncbi:MAG: methyltransferase [Chitinophagaceae bacterium]